MPARSAEATWQGSLKEGSGTLKLGSGAYSGPFTYLARFEDNSGTNPEELVGAAYAGCFTMGLGNRLSVNGFTVNNIHTTADVTLEKIDGQNTITKIVLHVEGNVEGIDEVAFVSNAQDVAATCIISRALNPEIQKEVIASLVTG